MSLYKCDKLPLDHIYISILCLVLLSWLTAHGCPNVCTCGASIVDCSNRGMDYIPEDIPGNTSVLYLNGNNFTNVSSQMFPDLPELLELDIGNCQIKAIQPLSFSLLPSLKILRLSYNHIVHLSPLSLGNLSLSRLYLNSNPLQNISSKAFVNTTFEELNLERCRLETISVSTFEAAKGNFKVLYLSENQLRLTLPKGLFSGIYFRYLYLNKNGLQSLQCLHNASVDILEANDNLLGNNVWAAIEEMQYIKEGYFIGNSIQYINVTKSVLSITYLSLESNNIRQITGNTFVKMPHLFTLNLHDNQINNIPLDLDKYLKELTVLDMGENFLSDFSSECVDNSNLTYLDLSGNRFEVITADTRRLFERLETVVLYGNPIRCNCLMFEFYRWAKGLRVHDTQLWGAECMTPRKVPIISLRPRDFICQAPEVSSFSILVSDQFVKLGSIHTLLCIADGEPPPTLQIVMASGVQTILPPEQGQASQQNSIIHPLTVECSDIGLQYCIASNVAGNKTSYYNLAVTDEEYNASCVKHTTPSLSHAISQADRTTYSQSGTQAIPSNDTSSITQPHNIRGTTLQPADMSVTTASFSVSGASQSTRGVTGRTQTGTGEQITDGVSTAGQGDTTPDTGTLSTLQYLSSTPSGPVANTQSIPTIFPRTTTTSSTSTVAPTESAKIPPPSGTAYEESPTIVQKFAIIFGVVILTVLLVLITAKLIYWSRTAKKAYDVNGDPTKIVYDNTMTDSDKAI